MMKVSELISKLQAMPQDATVVIDDADTSWLLHVQNVSTETVDHFTVVKIGGGYDERYAE